MNNPMTKQVSAEAAALAREIFKLGDDPNSPCNRIQFKGGKWPHDERNQGGISEVALAEFIDKSRATLPSAGDGKDSERLDWLEAQAKQSRTGISLDYVNYAEDGRVIERGFRFMRYHELGNLHKSVREAIDKARGVEPSPPPPQPAAEGAI